MTNSRGVLLDTHIWIRLQTLSHPLSPEAMRAIENAAVLHNVYVPAISVWETALLTARNRLELDIPVKRWVEEALNKPGIQLLPFTPEIAIEALALPEPMHKDPVDRMIVASALVERMTLITCDKPILRFASRIGLECIRG
jgi:PIN domain nuclease of toxin-antitoxin system